MWSYNNTDELYHYGVLGMKWGVRRFQNKDGSLTKKGKINRKKDSSKDEKKIKPSESKEIPVKKKVSEMSDEELRTKVNRMQLEKQAYELDKQIAALNPRQVSAGEKFLKTITNDVIGPAAKNAGKAYLEKTLKDKLGLNNKNADSLDTLRKEVAGLSLRKQKTELYKYFDENK